MTDGTIAVSELFERLQGAGTLHVEIVRTNEGWEVGDGSRFLVGIGATFDEAWRDRQARVADWDAFRTNKQGWGAPDGQRS